MQIGALTLKISENNNEIDNLLEVDKNIKNDIDNVVKEVGNLEDTLNLNTMELPNIKTSISNLENYINNNINPNITQNYNKIKEIDQNIKIS